MKPSAFNCCVGLTCITRFLPRPSKRLSIPCFAEKGMEESLPAPSSIPRSNLEIFSSQKITQLYFSTEALAAVLIAPLIIGRRVWRGAVGEAQAERAGGGAAAGRGLVA